MKGAQVVGCWMKFTIVLLSINLTFRGIGNFLAESRQDRIEDNCLKCSDWTQNWNNVQNNIDKPKTSLSPRLTFYDNWEVGPVGLAVDVTSNNML